MVVPAAVAAGVTVASISPTAGTNLGGTSVTITGTGFSSIGTTTINFNSTSDTAAYMATGVNVTSDTTITAFTPAHGAGVVNVQVINSNGAGTLNNAYTYYLAPTVTILNQSYGKVAGGDVVNISGTNLAGATSVLFGTTQNVTALGGDNSNITVTTPAHAAGTVSVIVNTPGGSATNSTGFIYEDVPAITGVSPAFGTTAGGDVITITGTGNLAGASKVYINETLLTPTSITSTSVKVTTPTGVAGWVKVNITTPGGVSADNSGVFKYYGFANITGVSTTNTGFGLDNGTVLGGTTVTITGTNLTTASAVYFNNTAATIVGTPTATSITVTSPAYPLFSTGTNWLATNNTLKVPVNVTTMAGNTTDIFGNFTYNIPLPNITSISPTTGSTAGGYQVTITGKNFTAAKVVYFGNLANTTAGLTVSSDGTSVTATVPSSSTIGDVNVNVTTPAGTTVDTAKFTYAAGTPTITTVSPAMGSDNGGQWVNITGEGFTGTSWVKFGDVQNTTALTVFNDTQLTVQTPAHSAGTVYVIVNAAGGAITKQNAYTFAGSPTFTSISPLNGTVNGGTTVTITGTNLTGASSVTFNSTAATIVGTSTATSITAITPAHVAGKATVNITTFSGTGGFVATNDAFTFASGPSITSISPLNGTISGGTEVTLRGTNLTGVTLVTFGGIPATNWSGMSNDTWIQARSPASTAGAVDVTVSTLSGSATSPTKFTYIGVPTITSISPAAGMANSTTDVTITGTSFTGVTTVTFGGAVATNMVFVNDTTITATAPSHVAGAVTVQVNTPNGAGFGTFTYVAAPTFASISPVNGTVLGGTPVTITGTGFAAPATVTFGSVAATNVNVVSATSITATTPAQTAAGAVNVTVTTTGGAVTSTNAYTYLAVPTVSTAYGTFRNSNGIWYLTDTNGTLTKSVAFGKTGDIPVVGDWNGAGKTEIGVFRPSTGTWYLDYNGDGTVGKTVTFGKSGDTPVVGDWNKAGHSEIGVFRPSTSTWYVNYNFDGTVDKQVKFGKTGDAPVVGDFNTDGYSDVGVFRASTGTWYATTSFSATPDKQAQFGKSGDTPVVGDWDVTGTSGIGVFRASTGTWYLNDDFSATVSHQAQFGKSGDTPIVGDWNNAGHSEIGVYRPSTGYWYMAYTFSSTTDKQFQFGKTGDTPKVATKGWAEH
ncbi:beta strand repeat-containing protein [Methanoregula sp.]|uniref:beta strand repeat-containing protein n=1 Tax=Methanoregula sp. TaxID=2052170 RepID=UPI00356609E2